MGMEKIREKSLYFKILSRLLSQFPKKLIQNLGTVEIERDPNTYIGAERNDQTLGEVEL